MFASGQCWCSVSVAVMQSGWMQDAGQTKTSADATASEHLASRQGR